MLLPVSVDDNVVACHSAEHPCGASALRGLKGKQFIKELNRRLRGHYNYYGLRGNSESLYRFYKWAKQCAFKWLNRRGGKRKSFTWAAFERALDRLGIALPKITEVKRQHVVYA